VTRISYAAPDEFAHVVGLGLRAPNLSQILESTQTIISQNNLDQLYEVIWNDVFDEDAVAVAIRTWAHDMLARHLEETKASYEKRMAEERAFLERRAQSPGPHVMMRLAGPSDYAAFTRTTSRPFRDIVPGARHLPRRR